MAVKFGTDGWRDIIADGFTFENVRTVARAHAQVLRLAGGNSVVIGFDTRFQGQAFAGVVAEVMAEQGLDVWLAQEYLPTPALSFAVVHYQAAGGVMITASHNPAAYNGYKVKGSYGGSATPSLIADIEQALQRPVSYQGPRGQIHPFDIRNDYYALLTQQLDTATLRNCKVKIIHDSMGGAASGWLSGYFQYAQLPIALSELHQRPDPLFHGVNPEPVQANLGVLMQHLASETGTTFGVVTDGDGDRVGVVTAGGKFFNSHQIFAVLIKHLYQRGLRGRVVKTVSGSRIIELLCQKLEIELLETAVGFKYITDAILEGETDASKAVMIGGEESGGLSSRGHIPERDGILNSLLLIEAVSASGKSLPELFAEIEQQVGFQHVYDRADLHLTASFDKPALMSAVQKCVEISGLPVIGVKTLDGVKLMLEQDASVMFRASGTEPVVRIYVEAQTYGDVQRILSESVQLVKQMGKSTDRVDL